MYIFTSNLRKLTIFIYFFGGFRQHSMKPVSISSIIYRGISPPDNKSRQQKVHWIVSTKKKKKKWIERAQKERRSHSQYHLLVCQFVEQLVRDSPHLRSNYFPLLQSCSFLLSDIDGPLNYAGVVYQIL